MMIAEGVIAMVWAAAALSIYNIAPENLTLPPAQVLANAVNHHLGRGLGMLTVAGVIILIITSGDTGLRSLRMITAEAIGVEQRTMRSRILVVLPLVGSGSPSPHGCPFSDDVQRMNEVTVAVSIGAAVALVFAVYALRVMRRDVAST